MNNNIPHHIALIADGNRRWAKEKRLPSLIGHWHGYKNLIEFCEWCKNRGVKILTVFGFSTENWTRAEKEVNYLMKLFEKSLLSKKNIAKFQRDGIKIKIIGQKERLPESLQKVIVNVEKLTKNNKNLQMNIALSYGGRWDIVQAVQKIINKKIPAEKVTEDLIEQNLSLKPSDSEAQSEKRDLSLRPTADLPAPDLIIRPGGEKRLSNFILWQAAYSELYFCKKHWPAFSEKDLDDAIKEYNRRQRRFGK